MSCVRKRCSCWREGEGGAATATSMPQANLTGALHGIDGEKQCTPQSAHMAYSVSEWLDSLGLMSDVSCIVALGGVARRELITSQSMCEMQRIWLSSIMRITAQARKGEPER